MHPLLKKALVATVLTATRAADHQENSEGVIFVADYDGAKGARLRGMKELGASVFRLKELHPTLNITLYCDETTRELLQSTRVGNLASLASTDLSRTGGQTGAKQKATALLNSPYDKTIFFDSDYFVLSGSFLGSMFELLNRFDLVQPMAWARHTVGPHRGFPNLCTCMIALRRNNVTSYLMQGWENLIKDGWRGRDQEALFELTDRRWRQYPDLRIWSLPEEYQCALEKSATGQPYLLSTVGRLKEGLTARDFQKGGARLASEGIVQDALLGTHECQVVHTHGITYPPSAARFVAQLERDLSLINPRN